MAEFYFDKQAADLACGFFDNVLRQTKGEWAGQPFRLMDWQRNDIIRPLFGTKHKSTQLRRYRTAFIAIPRKNGKSTLCAGIGLCMLFMDREPGAEIYSAAADREQAAIVFDQAKAMLENSSALARLAKVLKRSIVLHRDSSIYRVLSSDAPTKHGLNPHGIVFDELHAQRNRELWDVLTTATGARRQPMTLAITTAGYDRQSICFEMWDYALKVRSGALEDKSFFTYIAAANDDDDWQDEAVWARANPALGHTVKMDYLRGEANKAKHNPAYQNTFRRLHLNQWTQQETRWLDITKWIACKVSSIAFEGRVCYGGLDLASTSDLAAFVLVCETSDGVYAARAWFWMPDNDLVERGRRDRVPYDAWVRDGLITATPGNVIDYDRIIADIKQLAEEYNIGEIAFDRWGAVQVSTKLQDAGLSMVQFGQGFNSMSTPTKELYKLVTDGKFQHDGNPVLTWMADNVVVDTDAAGNVKPNKQKSRQRIDGIVGTVMALDRATRNVGVSIYETEGLTVL